MEWQCHTIVLEDLRTYTPPKHKQKLSRKLSNWLRGSLYDVLAYKVGHFGLKILRVSARWTSSYYPRCGAKGQKIIQSCDQIVDPLGRFYSCPRCNFTTDRDYIAALNIYRMYLQRCKKRYSLHYAMPVSYMGAGLPRNRPRGDAVQCFSNS